MSYKSDHLLRASSRKELIEIANSNNIPIDHIIAHRKYLIELAQLQSELVTLQKWVNQTQQRVVILFEGRDAAGKGGSIKRFKEHLNPRSSRIVALTKPTEVERGQWYFRRYIKELPNPGEIVLFDRSWYNRAVVEPVMGFCEQDEYDQFITQVPEFEHLLYENGIRLIKFWFAISKEEQKRRFDERLSNPLKKWKFSPVDFKSQELWDSFTKYKQMMFNRTHTNFSPWIIVKTNDKKQARLESIRYVLSQFEFEGKGHTEMELFPDPNVIMRYHRNAVHIDI